MKKTKEKEKKRPKRVHIGDTYHPLSAARDLGYPMCILEAIRKAENMNEIEKIMVDARHGRFSKYEELQKIQGL